MKLITWIPPSPADPRVYSTMYVLLPSRVHAMTREITVSQTSISSQCGIFEHRTQPTNFPTSLDSSFPEKHACSRSCFFWNWKIRFTRLTIASNEVAAHCALVSIVSDRFHKLLTLHRCHCRILCLWRDWFLTTDPPQGMRITMSNQLAPVDSNDWV